VEGVVVSAEKDGSTVTRAVVRHDQGRYGVPGAKLQPGH